MSDTAASPAIQPGVTAGRLLREARQAQGLHIAALASAIKVSPRKLELLESDRLDELPDATFSRALAQTVCRSLKVDAAPILALLPRAPGSPLQVGAGLNTPFRDRPGRLVPSDLKSLGRPQIWAPVVLLIAAAAVYLMPSGWLPNGAGRGRSTEGSSADGAASGAAMPKTAAASDVAPAPAQRQAGSVDAASAPAFGEPASQISLAVGDPVSETGTATAQGPAAVPVAGAVPGSASAADLAARPVLVAAAPATVSTASSTGSASTTGIPGAPPAGASAVAPAGAVKDSAANASKPLQLRAIRDSWIEVVDSRGQTLLSRLVHAGESVGLDGAAPLRLKIGNASGTEVQFRGQPMELAPYTRDNLARLELK